MKTLSPLHASALVGAVQRPALLVEAVFPAVPIEYIGGGSGRFFAELPPHKIGDIVIVFAFRDGSTTAPAIPTGWTQIGTGGVSSCAYRCGYQVSDGTLTNTGAWLNATSLTAVIYRNVASIGATAQGAGITNTIKYSGLSLTQTNGTSVVVGMAGHRSPDIAMNTAVPAGMTLRQFDTSTDYNRSAAYDTGDGVASWADVYAPASGTSSGWFSRTIELVQATEVTLRWSSHGTVTWDGKTWTAHPIRVSGLQVEALRISGTLTIDNRDGDIGTRIVTSGIHDVPIRIWSHDAAAATLDDVTWLCDAVGGSATITELEAAISLRHAGQFVVSPRVTVIPQNGFVQLLPSGTLLRINGQDYKLERR